MGAPEDSLFNSAVLPRVVVMGLSSDFEAELDFVHRLRARVGECGWILISGVGDSSELERLFDTLEVRILPWPPPSSDLRRAIRALSRVRSVAPLSQRTGRESLSARFARWFGEGELHWLLRTLDPSLASTPLLVRGEAGTGRRLLARYIHAFGSEPGAAFVPVYCEGVETASQLLSQLDVDSLRTRGQPPPSALTIWLDELDRLPPTVQRQLLGWIDFGTPRGVGLSHLRVRWTASAGDEAAEQPGRQLEAELEQALSGLVVRLAPLRGQHETIERFARNTAAAFCEERGTRTREFDSETLRVLARYPWPGNLRELESVVTRTLASSSSSCIGASELRFDSEGPVDDAKPTPGESPADSGAIQNALIERDPVPTAGDVLGTTGANETEISVEAEFEPHEVGRVGHAAQHLGPANEVDTENHGAPLAEVAAGPADQRGGAVPGWERILQSVAHEIRNPLVSIRTFSELLPEHHDDPAFRERFAELVGADVRRIEGVVTRLQELSELSHAKRQPVDIVSLLDDLMEERRDVIEARNLLVLKELDSSHPTVLGDSQLLRSAFGGILSRALEWVPERGDLYLASRHRSEGSGSGASVRILLRFQGGSDAEQPGFTGAAPTLTESTLEFAAARAVIVGHGGTLTVDAADRETVLVADLPAPA